MLFSSSTIPLSPAGRRYGRLDNPVSPKDWMFSLKVERPLTLPTSVNLLPYLGPVKDQGSLGACTAFSASYMREFLSKKFVGTWTPLSPLFIYYVERSLDGDVNQDAGSTISRSMQVISKYGACPETDDPYNVSKFTVKPTAKDYSDALTYIGGAYTRIMNITDAKNCLANGQVWNMGFLVYSSFESTYTANTGIMTMPKAGEQLLGGHAVCCYGYDDTFKFPGTSNVGALLVRNSWGATWGNKGNFYMPYIYLNRFVSDCWTQVLSTSLH